ncbi:heparan-alpha-glucosaminide N-acetyltransferase [Butyrivibrio sp. AE2032]|uniref:heparan-alpha-glucosaminide N-acetyltransferase n=1 Tax=Butyrivibrio sp. AE2032 TaxID=1458463 RepID=UPI0005509D8E|nr:heparan-alpha-glucosaminide N-acetyltransferase [Butyrivibrio sp. AE2032]
MSKKRLASDRAWELDLLRGIALLMMLFMHMSWDVRYEFRADVFSYLEKGWFWSFVHPVIVVLFVSVSGICCTFSRNNVKRGLKLLGATVLLTVVTYIVTNYAGLNCLILFNVLAVLTCGIFLYALISFIEKKTKAKPAVVNVIMGIVGLYIVICGCDIHYMDYSTESLAFLPVGFEIAGSPWQADYMPLFPWLGVFLIGCVIGRVCYKDKKTLFAGRGKVVKAVSRPIEFIGRHSLIIYLAHQPVVYGILYLIFLAIRAFR